MPNSGNPPDEQQSKDVTLAVMLAKIEVRLDQFIQVLDEYRKDKEEQWLLLRQLQQDHVAFMEWRRQMERDRTAEQALRARSPNWVSIVSVIVALASFAVAAGIIGTR